MCLDLGLVLVLEELDWMLLQVISLEDILSIGNSSLDGRYKNDQMRALSLTVYSQCRRLLIHQNGVKSLTGFGPAAAAELFLKGKEVSPNLAIALQA
jgi:mediator of RNA polymerase II transcription subunit 13